MAVPRPASVASKLRLSNSALRTRAVRDGLREKILQEGEGKVLRRAIIAPQELTSPMRVLTSAKHNMQRANVTDRGMHLHKKHRDKIGEMLWIFRLERCAMRTGERTLLWASEADASAGRLDDSSV